MGFAGRWQVPAASAGLASPVLTSTTTITTAAITTARPLAAVAAPMFRHRRRAATWPAAAPCRAGRRGLRGVRPSRPPAPRPWSVRGLARVAGTALLTCHFRFLPQSGDEDIAHPKSRSRSAEYPQSGAQRCLRSAAPGRRRPCLHPHFGSGRPAGGYLDPAPPFPLGRPLRHSEPSRSDRLLACHARVAAAVAVAEIRTAGVIPPVVDAVAG